MPESKKVPASLKFIFNRTKWQSKENKAARMIDPSVELDGEEFMTLGLFFPNRFFDEVLLQKDFIKMQLANHTKGKSRNKDKSFTGNAKKYPIKVYGYPCEGTNKRDMFYQLSKHGFDIVNNEPDEEKKRQMIARIEVSKGLERIVEPATKRKKSVIGTQTPILVSKEFHQQVVDFRIENKIVKSGANCYYQFCLIALDSF